jgi:hypothetical protein
MDNVFVIYQNGLPFEVTRSRVRAVVIQSQLTTKALPARIAKFEFAGWLDEETGDEEPTNPHIQLELPFVDP